MFSRFACVFSNCIGFLGVLGVTVKTEHSECLVFSKQLLSSILSWLLFVLFSVLIDGLDHLSWLKWLRKWTVGLFVTVQMDRQRFVTMQGLIIHSWHSEVLVLHKFGAFLT